MKVPSIPNVSSSNGPGPVAGSTSAMNTPPKPVLQTSATPAVVAEVAPPVPARFPWLSRLTQQLEQAAKQHPAFNEAPILGENLDRSA
jgi:hypothetical protein